MRSKKRCPYALVATFSDRDGGKGMSVSRIFFLFLLVFVWGQAAPSTAASPERRDYTSGTGHSSGGYAGTWEDADTGDINTTVIAPRQPGQQQPWPPIYVYPQVAPTWPPEPGGRPQPPAQGWPSPIAPARPGTR